MEETPTTSPRPQSLLLPSAVVSFFTACHPPPFLGALFKSSGWNPALISRPLSPASQPGSEKVWLYPELPRPLKGEATLLYIVCCECAAMYMVACVCV